MATHNRIAALILGVSIAIGLALGGKFLADAAIAHKLLERTVTVKGLSQQEYPADIVIWPIKFTTANNNLAKLYQDVDAKAQLINQFLLDGGVEQSEISLAPPAINDKSAHQYGGGQRPEFRYTASQTVTVYSKNISQVRDMMSGLSQLGKKGIVFATEDYDARVDYLFTRLNEVKPDMIEEATNKARETALKFASDSQSTLGKIKRASQGQFSISNRDKNNPHIKRVRVVSTVEYYLAD